jgi:hypothetical protein
VSTANQSLMQHTVLGLILQGMTAAFTDFTSLKSFSWQQSLGLRHATKSRTMKSCVNAPVT